MRKEINNLPEGVVLSSDSFYVEEEKNNNGSVKYVVYAHNGWSVEDAYTLDMAKRLMDTLQYAEDIRDEVEANLSVVGE